MTHQHALIAVPEERQALLLQSAHRLAQISEGGRVVEVQAAAGVVRQDPGEHGVLVQVIVCPPSQHI